ncbi:MAG: YCF48-related protein [Gemmataceae bacterium]
MPPIRLLAASVVSFLTLTLTLTSVRANSFPPSYDDAPLRAVTFVDKTEGWAVGDHGVIWHTVDGGKFWERQKSGTRASLRAVQFLTPYTGYAVGRTETPVTLGHSGGVVLMTKDGGLNWTEITSGLMPGLSSITFFNEKKGIIVGDSTPAFPTGIFITTDGGVTWKPQDGPRNTDWVYAEFRDAANGVMVGGQTLAVLENGSPVARLNTPGQRVMNARIGTTFSVACTSGGTVYVSKDQGLNWNPSKPLPATVNYGFDAAAISGDQAWVLGNHGTVLVHSKDQGTTWELQATKSPVPLNAIHMADEKTGWAVGELGTIMATTDGGRKWDVQRTGGQRCGVLFIHAHGADVPFDQLAMLGAKDGHLCGVIQAGHGVDSNRLSAAVRECGGALTVCLNPDESQKTRIGHLAMIIRQWRPEAIIVDRIGVHDEGDAVRNAVLEAARIAADPYAEAEQITTMKLAACSMAKVFAIHPTTKGATLQMDASKFVPELAEDVRDFCELSPSLLGARAKVPNFRFLASLNTSEKEAPKEIIGDALFPRGGQGRRKALPPAWPAEYLAAKEKIAVARRKIDQVVARPADFGGGEKALEMIRSTLIGLPEDIAARTAGIAANELARTGQWGMAHEMHGFIVESFEPYPEAAESTRWLLTFHTSSQIRRRIELGHVTPLPKTIFDTVENTSGVKTASHTETGPDYGKTMYRFRSGESSRKWDRFAVDLEPKLIAYGPGLAYDPMVLFSRQLAKERAGMLPGKERPAADKTFTAIRFNKKPMLDGKLDEADWKAAPAVTLDQGEFKTETRFGYDDRFLYVSIAASHAIGRHKPKVEVRERDADLSSFDRVEFAFDLDRGFGETAFRFAIDQRGCLNESCWGDGNWDPKWFVSFQSSNTDWTAEIAIPLAELTGDTTTPKLWGVELKRTIPGVAELNAGKRCDLLFNP